jgi:hypothetical protein
LYNDEDGDSISISCQEDFEEAFENTKTNMKLIIKPTTTKAEYNMPMNLDGPEKININFGFSTNTNESVIFEDIKS